MVVARAVVSDMLRIVFAFRCDLFGVLLNLIIVLSSASWLVVSLLVMSWVSLLLMFVIVFVMFLLL